MTVPPRVRAPQTTVSLDWLLGLTGALEDEAPSAVRFRENIESPNIKLAEVEIWVRQALVHPLEHQRLLALQDLMNSVGKRLGFGVTYGRYEKRDEDWLGFDGLWRIEHDLFATVDVYSARLEGIDLRGLAEARARLTLANKLLAKSDLVHLFVLCDDYAPEVEAEIRRSDFHDTVRLMPVTTLFEILRMYVDGIVSTPQLPFFFRSYDSVGIHNVVLFLEQFIAGYDAGAAAGETDHGADVATVAAHVGPGLERASEVRRFADGVPPTSFQAILEAMDAGEVGADVLAEFVATHPEDLRAGEYYGDLMDALGESDRALSAYERVLEREPARESLLLKALDILKLRHEYARALALVDRTSPAVPRGAVAVRAELLLLSGKPAECRAACEVILAEEPGRPDLYRLMGAAFEAEEAWAEAVACYEKAVHLSPADVESKRRVTALRKRLATGA